MFEIHITVDCLIEDFDSFRILCKSLGVKPLAIYLNSDKTQYHIMTSSVFYGDFCSVHGEVERICVGLKDYRIIRRKIETHPRAVFEANKLDECLYYEVHIEVDNSLLDFYPEHLNCKWYVSNNFNRPDHTILTCRLYDWQDHSLIEKDFITMVNSSLILDYHRGVIYEFAIYDTNPELDKDWIK